MMGFDNREQAVRVLNYRVHRKEEELLKISKELEDLKTDLRYNQGRMEAEKMIPKNWLIEFDELVKEKGIDTKNAEAENQAWESFLKRKQAEVQGDLR